MPFDDPTIVICMCCDFLLRLSRDERSYDRRGISTHQQKYIVILTSTIQIDLLFISRTVWIWDPQKRFQELRLKHQDLVRGGVHSIGRAKTAEVNTPNIETAEEKGARNNAALAA
jgi:hypothetical protein